MAQTKLERHLTYQRGKEAAFKQVQVALDTYPQMYASLDAAWKALAATNLANLKDTVRALDNPPDFLRSTATRTGR